MENVNNLYYPSAMDWMWNYCIYLGPYTDGNGINYDLGIYISDLVAQDDHGVSLAAVYGNQPGTYLCGPLEQYVRDKYDFNEIYREAARRAAARGLLPSELIEHLTVLGVEGFV